MKISQTILWLAALLLSVSCQSPSDPQPTAISNDPVIAKAGWKIGQVYKTLKRGGVVKYGSGQLALNTENSNSMVEEAWQNPEYRNKLFAYKVEPGTLFQVIEVRHFPAIYSVFAVQLPSSPKSKRISMGLFEGGSETLIGENGFIIPRDPNYLVPVEMPTNLTKSTNTTHKP